MEALLLAISNVLKSIREYIVEPSRENEEKLVKHLLELDEAYRQFEIQMNKVLAELEKGNIKNIKEDLSKYDSILDKNFLQVVAKVEQIAKDIELLNMHELAKPTQALTHRSEKVVGFWKELQTAISSENPKRIQRVLRWNCEIIEKYVRDVKVLADRAQQTLKKRQFNLPRKNQKLNKKGRAG